TFKVNPSADARVVLSQTRDNVQLTNGARPTSFEVRDGQLIIAFEHANPGTVQAILPDELATGIVGTATGAPGVESGIASPPVLAGGAVLAATGVTVGALIAADVIHDDG